MINNTKVGPQISDLDSLTKENKSEQPKSMISKENIRCNNL